LVIDESRTGQLRHPLPGLLYNAIPITSTKTVAAVTLPDAIQIHIFDVTAQP
jgi:hypothetical protein